MNITPETIMLIVTLIMNVLQTISDALLHFKKIDSTCTPCGGRLTLSRTNSVNNIDDNKI